VTSVRGGGHGFAAAGTDFRINENGGNLALVTMG
jgi:hypothetical protein